MSWLHGVVRAARKHIANMLDMNGQTYARSCSSSRVSVCSMVRFGAVSFYRTDANKQPKKTNNNDPRQGKLEVES